MNLWVEYTDIIYASLTSEVFDPISCIETLYHHWIHVSMIYYVKNNAFLYSPSLKNINHPLFLWHM
ncbi:hypothetical protein CR513_15980, partial [Mucuna pruriens]